MSEEIAELQARIENLSAQDFKRLRAWIIELDNQRWDSEFESDVKAGKFKKQAEKALAHYAKAMSGMPRLYEVDPSKSVHERIKVGEYWLYRPTNEHYRFIKIDTLEYGIVAIWSGDHNDYEKLVSEN